MLISPSTDLLRIASTVVTGVGFLGGGILLREGVSTSSVRVKGINTAATLWCAAAVGAASGLGLWTQAGFATGLLLVVNIVLRILVKKFDRPMVEE
jgi:putative Mg2+ transporter-C (MgtC) family protein